MAPVSITRRFHPTNMKVGQTFLQKRGGGLWHKGSLTTTSTLADGVRKAATRVGHEMLLPSVCLVSKKDRGCRGKSGIPVQTSLRAVQGKERRLGCAWPEVGGWGASFWTDFPYTLWAAEQG